MSEAGFANTHAVTLYLRELDFDFMIELSERLEAAVERAGAGVFDGNEIGGGETVLFLYGPDADVLFASIQLLLEHEEAAIGAKAVLRYGSHGAPERDVIIGNKSSLQ